MDSAFLLPSIHLIWFSFHFCLILTQTEPFHFFSFSYNCYTLCVLDALSNESFGFLCFTFFKTCSGLIFPSYTPSFYDIYFHCFLSKYKNRLMMQGPVDSNISFFMILYPEDLNL